MPVNAGMRSMTGYGRATAVIGKQTLTVQVSSVNRRTLDLSVSLPPEWESLEPQVGERVRRVVARGKVHVSIELPAQPGEDEASWDDADVRVALDRLANLAAAQAIAFRPTPELLWQIANSRRKSQGFPSAEDARPVVIEALDEALHGFAVMRAKEGEALLVDFLARVAALWRMVEAIAARAPLVAPAYRELLLRRLREAGLDLDLDDERVLKEIALFADRCDISEEITRFRSHLEQFAALIKSGGEIGRKAEFILQEMGRESHTMGSKSNDLAISRHVIELKNEIERVKEQIANVE
ncbi:MAG: YicC/YloC family endoribonuclease [Opitutaceae bacterium]